MEKQPYSEMEGEEVIPSSSLEASNGWRRYQVVRQLVTNPALPLMVDWDTEGKSNGVEQDNFTLMSEESMGFKIPKVFLRATLQYEHYCWRSRRGRASRSSSISSSRSSNSEEEEEEETGKTRVDCESRKQTRRSVDPWIKRAKTEDDGSSIRYRNSYSYSSHGSSESRSSDRVDGIPLGMGMCREVAFDLSKGPGTVEEATTLLSSTLREKLQQDIPSLNWLGTKVHSFLALNQNVESVVEGRPEGSQGGLLSSGETTEGIPGSAWFWEGYRAALYGHQVFFHMRGTGVDWREDGLFSQALLRQPRYFSHALRIFDEKLQIEPAESNDGNGASSSDSLPTSPMFPKALFLSSFLQLSSCKLDILSGILSSFLTHLLLQPLLEAHEGPSALLLCATKDQCEECFTLLSSWAAPFHLLVHNAWDPLPPSTLRFASCCSGSNVSPAGGVDGSKVTDIVIATPPLWEQLVGGGSTYASGQMYQKLCGLPSLDIVSNIFRRESERRERRWTGRGGSGDSFPPSSSHSFSECLRRSYFPISYLLQDRERYVSGSSCDSFSTGNSEKNSVDSGRSAPWNNSLASSSHTGENFHSELWCWSVVDERDKKECLEEMLLVLERLSKAAITSVNRNEPSHLEHPGRQRGDNSSKSRTCLSNRSLENTSTARCSFPPTSSPSCPSFFLLPSTPIFHPFIRTPYSPLIRPYRLSHIAQIALIDVNTQLAMGYGPLLERIFLRRGGVDANAYSGKARRNTGNEGGNRMDGTQEWRRDKEKRGGRITPFSPSLSISGSPFPHGDPREKAQEMIDWLLEDVQWYVVDGDQTGRTGSRFSIAGGRRSATERKRKRPHPLGRENGRSFNRDGSIPLPNHCTDRAAENAGDSESDEEELREVDIIEREEQHFVHTVLRKHWAGGGQLTEDGNIDEGEEDKGGRKGEEEAKKGKGMMSSGEQGIKRTRMRIPCGSYGVADIHLSPPSRFFGPIASTALQRSEEIEGEKVRGKGRIHDVRETPTSDLWKKSITTPAIDGQGSDEERVEGLLFLHGITACSVYLDPSVYVELMEGIATDVLQFWDAFGPISIEHQCGDCSRADMTDGVRADDGVQAIASKHFFSLRLAFLQDSPQMNDKGDSVGIGRKNIMDRGARLDNVGILLAPRVFFSSFFSPSCSSSSRGVFHLVLSRWRRLLSHLEEKMSGMMFDGHVLRTCRVMVIRMSAMKERVEKSVAQYHHPHHLPQEHDSALPLPSAPPLYRSPFPFPSCRTPTEEESGTTFASHDSGSLHDSTLSSSPSSPFWLWHIPCAQVVCADGDPHITAGSSSSSATSSLSQSHFQTHVWECLLRRQLQTVQGQKGESEKEEDDNDPISHPPYFASPAFLCRTSFQMSRHSHKFQKSTPPERKQKVEMERVEEEEKKNFSPAVRTRLAAYRWMTLGMEEFVSSFSTQREVVMEERNMQNERKASGDSQRRKDRNGREECPTHHARYFDHQDSHPPSPSVSSSPAPLERRIEAADAYCAFPYLCLALTGASSSSFASTGERWRSSTPLFFLPPAPLFSVVVIRHLCPGFCKETFSSMTTLTLISTFANSSVNPSQLAVGESVDELASNSRGGGTPPVSLPPLPALSVCIEECCKIGRVLSYYCYEDGQQNRPHKRRGRGGEGEDGETSRCRCPPHFHRREEKDCPFDSDPEGCENNNLESKWRKGRPSPPPAKFSISLFIEFERTEVAVEAVRLFQRQLQNEKQRQEEKQTSPPSCPQELHQNNIKERENKASPDELQGMGALPNESLPSVNSTPYYCAFPTVKLFRNESYYKGVAEEEEKMWKERTNTGEKEQNDSCLDERDIDEEDSDLEDIFFAHLSLLGEVE